MSIFVHRVIRKGILWFYCRAHTFLLCKFLFMPLQIRYTGKVARIITTTPDGDVNVHPRSCSFGLTRGARRKPIMGNTGPSFGCTVKQIFNEIFFSALWWLDRQPMRARTGRERGVADEGRTNARARVRMDMYMYKKKGEKNENSLPWSVLPDVGRRTRPWTGGSESPRFGKTRGRDRGGRAANGKKNATSHVARGREAAREFFFPPYKKGPRAVQR